MSVSSGRVVLSGRRDRPYKVILDHEGLHHHPEQATSFLFATLHEAEAFIRDSLPRQLHDERLDRWRR
jgi:hypothetical protein